MPRYNRFPACFAFRLEEDVAERLRQVAEAHGYRPAEWARKIVSDEIAVNFERRSVRLRVLHAELLRTYLIELQRQGNNINQLSRSLNSGLVPEDTALAETLDKLALQHDAIVTAVLDALGANTAP